MFSGTGSSVYSNLSGHADACLASILHTLLGVPDMYQPGLMSTQSYINGTRCEVNVIAWLQCSTSDGH